MRLRMADPDELAGTAAGGSRAVRSKDISFHRASIAFRGGVRRKTGETIRIDPRPRPPSVVRLLRARSTAGLIAAVLALLSGENPVAADEKRQLAAPWGTGEDAEQERFLLDAEIVESKDLGTGITRPRKMTLRLGERTGHAIWKDVHEEYARPNSAGLRLDELYFSDLWQHEVAAYRVDRLIGLGMVPVTVARAWRKTPGSLQIWVENATNERDRVRDKTPVTDVDRWAGYALRMQVFDLLIYNTDRNQQNVLVTEPGSRMWLIDHSRSFRTRPVLPSVKKSQGLRIPADFMERILALPDDAFRTALDGLLTKGQIKALLARRQKLRDLADPPPAARP